MSSCERLSGMKDRDPGTKDNGCVGTLDRIWLKRAKGGPMDPVRSAWLEQGVGLVDNANRRGRRQVTIISRERWAELMASLGVDLDPATRRANLLVSGLDLQNSRGRVLKVGAARLRINGETRPCERMEQAHPGLQAAMRERWGGGVFAEVLDGGEVRAGDPAEWELPLLD
jgi:hypothetical protein